MSFAYVPNAQSDLLDSHTTITVLGHDIKIIKSIINEGRKIHKMMKASGPRETLIYIQHTGQPTIFDSDFGFAAGTVLHTYLSTYSLTYLFTYSRRRWSRRWRRKKETCKYSTPRLGITNPSTDKRH